MAQKIQKFRKYFSRIFQRLFKSLKYRHLEMREYDNILMLRAPLAPNQSQEKFSPLL